MDRHGRRAGRSHHVGPLAIWQRGHYLGVWWHEDKEYRFARVAFQSPERTARTAAEALAKTIALVVRRSSCNKRRSRDPWLRFTDRMSG